jgi:CRP/FNR family transcriptional regulator, anaerobic regulatory protein
MLQSQTRSIAVEHVHFLPAGRARNAANAGAPQCSTCRHRSLCLTAGYAEPELESMDALMFARRKVKAGEALYRHGDAFQFLYAVRSGTFKSASTTRGGREHVTGFHLAGDVLGLDGLAEGHHASEAIALEDGEICAVPYRQLAELAAANRNMQGGMTQLLSRHIVGRQRDMMLLGSMSAEERVASFVMNISSRMEARGYSAREFHLRMSRADIGSYLGLTLETVSRALSAFQAQRLLQVAKKHIRILDLDAMTRAFEPRMQ